MRAGFAWSGVGAEGLFRSRGSTSLPAPSCDRVVRERRLFLLVPLCRAGGFPSSVESKKGGEHIFDISDDLQEIDFDITVVMRSS